MKLSGIRKTVVSLFCGLLVAGSATQAARAQQPKKMGNGAIMLDDFQNDVPGQFPKGWYDRDGNKQLVDHSAKEQARFKYSVKEENGNKFLHYQGEEAQHINFPLINKDKDNIYNINLSKTPILKWDWRVSKLPEGANEDDNGANDTAASIYVVFDFGHILFKKVPKTIRYTWSSTLPKGDELSKFFGNQKIVVLKSGSRGLGKWITMKRNIAEDYKRLFGDDPPETPIAILILSDGDSTHSPAEADYDNIMLLPFN